MCLHNAEVRVAALIGLIAGAIGHHSLESLVREPASVMVATVALLGAALIRSRHGANGRHKVDRYKLWPALILGVIAGSLLPASAPGPAQPVVTHAAIGGQRNELFEALDSLDDAPPTLLGKRIWVTGAWRPQHGNDLATVSQRVMACCAADAVDVGFDVLPARVITLPAGTLVRVSGIVHEVLREGEMRYVLTDADVEPLSGENNGAT